MRLRPAAESDNLGLGGGCTLYLKRQLVPSATTTNASGFGSLRLAVPLDAALRGATVPAQAFVFDPLGGAFGLAFSAGRALSIGD